MPWFVPKQFTPPECCLTFWQQIDSRVVKSQMDMESSQKLLKTQMDKAEHLFLVQSTLLFKDLIEHSWVQRGCSDIDTTLGQVWFIDVKVTFLQLLKSKFCQRLNRHPTLWTPVWIYIRFSLMLNIPQFGLNHQEMDVRLSQGCGQLSFPYGIQYIL